MNRLSLLSVSLIATALATGCAQSHPYAAAPPPPPGYREQAPPLLKVADRNGFEAGSAAGARDAFNGRGYHPQHDRAFHATPGYDPSLGPLPVYRSAFRDAFLRGYDEGFRRPRGME
jgi:hypothetical protein